MRARRLIVPLIAAGLVGGGSLASAVPAPQAPFLFSRPAYPTLVQPTSSALADLDGDGRMDLVSSVGINDVSWGISVLRGRERGFARASLATTGRPLTGVQVVDATGDGSPDVVASHSLGDGTFTGVGLAGDGRGGIGEIADLPFPPYADVQLGRFVAGSRAGAAVAANGELAYWRPGAVGFDYVQDRSLRPGDFSELLAVDLDGDGLDELLGISDGAIHAFRGLAFAGTLAIPGADAIALDAADVTGDGRPEALATTTDGRVIALDASLAVVRSTPVGQPGVGGTAGDLNGDGKAEIVRVNDGPSLTVFWATGGSVTVPLAQRAFAAFVGDPTGDGNPDLMAVETPPSLLEVVEGDGAGAFAPQRQPVVTQSAGWYVKTADFNRDGKLDFIAGQLNDLLFGYADLTTASVLLGNGQGGFTRGATVSTHGASTGLDVGDVNGDGRPDVVVSDYHSGTVSQYLGNGDGTFQPRIPVPGACTFDDEVAVADFNGDGFSDAAALCRTAIFQDHVAVFRGTPLGLTPAALLSVSHNAQTYVMRTGDINGDGLKDLAIGAFDHINVNPECGVDFGCMFQSGSRPVGYFLGVAAGVLSPTPRDYIVRRTYVDVWLADVNGDGRDDVLTPATFEDEVLIANGKADGSLAAPSIVPALEYPLGVSVADVTGDGIRDLVMDHGPMMISVTPGLGGGQFGEPTGYVARGVTGELRLGDFTGDGRLDAIVPEGGVAELFVQGR